MSMLCPSRLVPFAQPVKFTFEPNIKIGFELTMFFSSEMLFSARCAAGVKLPKACRVNEKAKIFTPQYLDK